MNDTNALGIPASVLQQSEGGYAYTMPISPTLREWLISAQAAYRQSCIDDALAFGNAIEEVQRIIKEDPDLFCAWFEENSIALTGMDLRKR